MASRIMNPARASDEGDLLDPTDETTRPNPQERNDSIFWSNDANGHKPDPQARREDPIPQAQTSSASGVENGNGQAATTNGVDGNYQRVKAARPTKRATIPVKAPSAGSSASLRPTQTKYATELGRRGQWQGAPLQRAQTSYLNTAIWSRCDEEYVSSSSSDDDDDLCPAPGDLTRTQTQLDWERRIRDDPVLRASCGPGEQQDGKGQTDRPVKQRKDTLLGGADGDDRYRRFLVGNDNYSSKGKIKKDGRLRITVNETAGTGYLAKALGAAIHKMVPTSVSAENAAKAKRPTARRLSSTSTFASVDISPRPRLNIVIMVIGSRGDVQPFLKIGRVLKEDYGHRVRIATHPTFREYVQRDSGLEFFSVGGDPSELMAFMVKNPGMIPTMETVRAGDIGKRRAAMAEMFDGFWRACINVTDDEKDSQNLKMMGAKNPFVADAIIANPPSFAHVHCAEALGIPLHLMFTFPYTPTQAFPHPLASIKKSNVDPGYTNFISYPMVEMMIWQGLGDLVNAFRVKTLNLDPVSTLWAPGATYRLHVPFTYLWSPGLVPKPPDWGDHIDVSGFVYLDLASNFEPPADLEAFLAAGEAPIYIGFGSIVVDDADRFTQVIFDAVEKAGVRALVSRGWGGFGNQNVPNNVFMLDNTPHDWLFPRVKAAVIHGGAGTTAIALKCALPTMIVPFFGDQHFWGKMVGEAKVGPSPIPYKYLTVDNFADGIKYLLTDEARVAVQEIARGIELEGDGARNAVNAFHRHLNLRGPKTMRCSLLKDHIASWQPKSTHVQLSPLAADILADAGYLSWRKLRLLRHTEWNDFEGPGEPVTGIAGSIVSTLGNTFKGIGGVPFNLAKTTKRNKRRIMRKKQRSSISNPPTPSDAENSQVSRDDDDALSGLDQMETVDQMTTSDIQQAYVGDVTSGVEMTATALAKAPVGLSVALAQGFHNAPRLYGDDTVRRPIRITGIRSGLRAARKEFVYGVYDGFTGVIHLPIRGAKKDGVIGFVKGTGMGLIGFILKNLAAIIGPFGYTLKGIVKQAERSKSPVHFIRRARITQGQREANTLSAAERRQLEQKVIEGFHVMKDLCDAITEEERRRGIAGHLDRLLMDTGVLFEDVEVAKKALRALRKGESLESLLNIANAEKDLHGVSH